MNLQIDPLSAPPASFILEDPELGRVTHSSLEQLGSHSPTPLGLAKSQPLQHNTVQKRLLSFLKKK